MAELSGPLFVTDSGMRLWRSTASEAVHRVGRLAGLGQVQVHPHVLRHAWATRAAELGVDPRLIQEYPNHESLNTTMVYLDAAKTVERDPWQLVASSWRGVTAEDMPSGHGTFTAYHARGRRVTINAEHPSRASTCEGMGVRFDVSESTTALQCWSARCAASQQIRADHSLYGVSAGRTPNAEWERRVTSELCSSPLLVRHHSDA
ncbi:tyrosine-type recombinase/integrase [Spongiactinospora sp. 9N601]